jgi:fatty acid synthase subunit beta
VISLGFGQDALQQVVKAIATQTGQLLEIVNFNVAGLQYVCAGQVRLVPFTLSPK